MSVAIKWNFNATAGVDTVNATSSLSVDAIDRVEVAVPPGTTTVQVQPGTTGKVHFLSIASSVYGTNLVYRADSNPAATLDSYHVFVGPGAVSLLGATQQSLMFINNGVLTAQVSIVAGRMAT
jgi:hypothetical protein